jgi:hypothetical protein
MEVSEYKKNLEADIEEARNTLARLEAAYAAISPDGGAKTTITGVKVIPGQFARMRVGEAVRAYLALKQPEPATMDELKESLALGGYEWPKGKSPRGNIRRSLPWNKELKEIGGLIYLNKKKT